MVQINFARKEINCKLVYYGPGLSGKTTNLEMVHARTPEGNRGELTSISTDGDRTLFFDFMPLDLGEIAGMKTKFHLYTVPGQVYYNSTRKLVLLGADGVIFVADSSRAKMKENLESLANLRENLVEMGKDFTKFPIVLQWNKRDMPDAMTVEELTKEMNPLGFPAFEGIANKGDGVFPTLKALSQLVLANINSSESSRSRDEKKPDDKTAKPAGAPKADKVAPPSPQKASSSTSSGLKIERNEVGAGPPPSDAPKPARSPALEPSLGAAAKKTMAPPMAGGAPRPAVASNPLDELQSVKAKAPPAPKAHPPMQPRPASANASGSAGSAPPPPPPAAPAQRAAPAIQRGATAVMDEMRSASSSSSTPNGQSAPSATNGSGQTQGADVATLAAKRAGAESWPQDTRSEDVFKREMRVIGGRPGGMPTGHIDTRKIMTIGVICGVIAALFALVLFKLFIG